MMDNQPGFSLLEILLALFIITSTFLGLLVEQLFMKRQLNAMQRQERVLLEQSNASERHYAK